MRVTNRMVYDKMQFSVLDNRDRLFQIQQKIAANRKLVNLSDDPRAAEKVSQYRSLSAEVDQFRRNISVGKSSLELTSNAFSGVSELIIRAKEISIQLANGDFNATDRLVASQEIDEILKQVIGYANTKAGSDYLFPGFQSNMPAYTSDFTSGNFGNWQGDAAAREIRISQGERLAINETGLVVFGTRASTGPPAVAGSGLMNTLDAFRTALETNDMAGIQTAIGALDTDLQTVLQRQAAVGTRIKRMEITDLALNSLSTVLESQISELEDLDIAEIATELKKQEAVLQASIQVAGRISSLSLLDSLG